MSSDTRVDTGDRRVMVIVDAASAGRLQNEGAWCIDACTGEVTRWGAVVDLPEDELGLDHPILVRGVDARQVAELAERLSRRGLPAWQVRG